MEGGSQGGGNEGGRFTAPCVSYFGHSVNMGVPVFLKGTHLLALANQSV